MFNSNIQIGELYVNFNNVKGTENGKTFAVDGSVSIGLSINSLILNKLEKLINESVRFEENKMTGKNKVQKMLDECELLEIEVRKARLLKQLEQLRK